MLKCKKKKKKKTYKGNYLDFRHKFYFNRGKNYVGKLEYFLA